MLCSLVLSLHLIRAIFGRWFLLIHRLSTLSGLAAMFWHALRQSQLRAQVIVGISCGIWAVFAFYRVFRLLRRRLSAEVVDICGDMSFSRIEIMLRKPIAVPPGKYFNIFFPGLMAPYTFLHSHSAVAFWHPPDDSCQRVSNISFLLSRHGSHAVALSQLKRGQRILLEGPFGKDLKLGRFENIIFAAKGIGIAGILPLALELSERKRHDNNIKKEIEIISEQLDKLQRQSGTDINLEQRLELQKKKSSLRKQPLFRDATTKIDIFWSLESNTQMDVLQDQLRALQSLDPENVSII
jgi:predicted ferric reductase